LWTSASLTSGITAVSGLLELVRTNTSDALVEGWTSASGTWRLAAEALVGGV
jgi:hypothetical protein